MDNGRVPDSWDTSQSAEVGKISNEEDEVSEYTYKSSSVRIRIDD